MSRNAVALAPRDLLPRRRSPTQPHARVRQGKATAMTFHDFGLRGMSVMDGNRCVAKARRIPANGCWLLRIYAAERTDDRAGRGSEQVSGTRYRQFLVIPRKPEARAILCGLARA